MHLQADSAGALGPQEMRPGSQTFDLGLGLILDGIRQRQAHGVDRA